ncbi:MAG: NifU family protein [Planctomycetes bacterium]|nr:NifU family protein [Planctomycetota bacterium]
MRFALRTAMKVTSIQPTPNPNAFKFLVDRPLAKTGQSLAYAKPEQAQQDVLAQGMFAIPGVETLFFCDNFVTVSMTAAADWRAVAEQVTRMLESHVVDESPTGAPGGAPAAPPADDPLASLPKGGDPAMLSRINALLDERVRPALAGDGGGLQVMGLDGKTLFIRYQGACGSCPSSTSGTLMAIQNLLQAEVDEELVVTMS